MTNTIARTERRASRVRGLRMHLLRTAAHSLCRPHNCFGEIEVQHRLPIGASFTAGFIFNHVAAIGPLVPPS